MSSKNVGKKLVGVWNTRTIVAVAIGAALFGVLMNYGGIPVFTNTSLTTAMVVPVVVGAMYGALPAAVAAGVGNVIVRTHSFCEARAHSAPPFPGKVIKLSFSMSPKILSLKFHLALVYREAELLSLFNHVLPNLEISSIPQLHQNRESVLITRK